MEVHAQKVIAVVCGTALITFTLILSGKLSVPTTGAILGVIMMRNVLIIGH